MLIRTLILLALLAAPAPAQAPMGAEAFDAYTRGKTLFYGFDGQPYGVEQYLDGRRVIWSFLDSDCRHGVWYEEAGQICFLYEHRSDPQCWSYFISDGRLTARFENRTDATEIYESEEIGEKMQCFTPEAGS